MKKVKAITAGIVLIWMATMVSADGLSFHRGTQLNQYTSRSQYTLVAPSYGAGVFMGVKQVSPSGPYFDPYNRGSRVNIGFSGYVPDTYSIHRPGSIPRQIYGQRMPGLPLRASRNRLTYGN